MSKILNKLDGMTVAMTIIITVFTAGFTTQYVISNITSSPRQVDEQLTSLVIANVANDIKEQNYISIDMVVRARDLCNMMSDGSNDSKYLDLVFSYDSSRTNCEIINNYELIQKSQMGGY